MSHSSSQTIDWSTLHERSLQAFSDSATGDDPRYNDDFSALKSEVQKRDQVDFQLIFDLSAAILQEQSKDLRVAGYLVLAASRLHGLEGFYEAIRLYHGLLVKFGHECHPQKEKARNSAVLWLLQERILIFIQKHEATLTHKLLENCVSEFQKFAEFQKSNGLDFAWPDLNNWLQKQETALRPQATPAEADANAEAKSAQAQPAKAPTPVQSSAPTSRTPAAPLSSLGSEAQVLQAYRQLIQHHREQQEYLAMVAVARACKWTKLKLPPHENGQSKVPAPRSASLAKISNAQENQQWLDVVIACEEAFMEPGGLFSLDIQHSLVQAARKCDCSDVADFVEAQVLLLLKRLPKLVQLKFDDQAPFVSPAASGWIDQLQTQSSASASGNSPGTDFLAIGREAGQESLEHGLQAITLSPTTTAFEQQQKQLAQAQLCIENKRLDLASPVLQALAKEIDIQHMAHTQPQFCMQAWRFLDQCLQSDIAHSDTDQARLSLQNQQAQVRAKMCTTDLATAAKWI